MNDEVSQQPFLLSFGSQGNAERALKIPKRPIDSANKGFHDGSSHFKAS